MTHKLVRFSLISLLIILSNCTSSDEGEPIGSHLNLVESVSILLPSLTKEKSTGFQSGKLDGVETILFVDTENNCVLRLHPNNSLPPVKHCFPREGPGSIKKVRGADFYDSHTIIVSSIEPTYHLYDVIEGSLRNINLMDEEADFEVGNFTSIYPEKFVTIGDLGYFVNNGKTTMNDLGRQFPKYPLVSSIDRKNSTINYTNFYFPKEYHAEKSLLSYASFAGGSDQLVVSLPSNHDLYTYNTRTRKQQRISARSQFLPDEFPSFDAQDAGNYYSYLAVQPMYLGILYDPYRNLYYRIAKLPAGEYQSHIEERTAVYSRYKHQFSIMVLDEAFNVLGEQLLPADTYNNRNIAVIEDGLLISKMHPFNHSIETEGTIEADVYLWQNAESLL